MSSYHKATYTIPKEVLDELNTLVEQRQRSRFVAEAIRMAVEIKKRELEDAYKEAAADKERNKEVEEWSALDVEGLE